MTASFGLVLGLELRRSRSATIWLVVVAVAYAGLVTAMYPIIQRNADLIASYLNMFPKGFMDAFGMSGSLAQAGVFFATYVGTFLWPVVVAIGAVLVATRVFAADVERGWTEIPLGTPLTRTTLALASIADQLLLIAALAVATIGSVLLVGVLVGAGFDPLRFTLAGLVLFACGCAVAAVTTLVAVTTLSRGKAAGLTAGLLLGMYLLNVITQLQPDLSWLGVISAFRYLSTTDLIDRGASPIGSLAVFGGVAFAAWIGAVLVFRRRDLVA